MKKLMALSLCLIMVLSLLAACGGNGGGLAANDGGASTPAPAQKVEAYDKKDLTITIGLRQNANVIDYEENYYTKWLEQKLGFNIDFMMFQSSSADWQAQLTGMITTGDPLPDVLLDMTLTKAAIVEYGQAGIFLDMGPYLNDPVQAAVWNERMTELPDDVRNYSMNTVGTGDGTVYSLGRMEYTMIDTIDFAPYVNTVWLEKLGLPMPNSIDSLYETLVAFRDKDPNGNGKKDEIPLLGNKSGLQGNVIGWIINMFTPYDTDDMVSVDDSGKIYWPQLTDEYREALKFMNKLIKEGLMFDTCFTMANKEVKGMVCPPEGEVAKVGVYIGHPSIVWEFGNTHLYDYEPMPYWGYFNLDNQAFDLGAYITKDCEVPQAAWDLIMMMYTKESSYIQRYGKPGEDWVDATPGSKSFLGWDAEMRIVKDIWGTQQNSNWARIMCTVLTAAENEASEYNPELSEEFLIFKYDTMKKTYDYAQAAKTPKNVYSHVYVPYEIQNDAETKEAWSNGKDLLNKALTSFVTGKGETYTNPNDDAQWNAYLKEFESLKVDKPLSYRQALYTEQFGG